MVNTLVNVYHVPKRPDVIEVRQASKLTDKTLLLENPHGKPRRQYWHSEYSHYFRTPQEARDFLRTRLASELAAHEKRAAQCREMLNKLDGASV